VASPVAVKEKWAAKRDKAFNSGVSFLPPDSTHAVLAMQIDLEMWLTMWQVAILELDHEPHMVSVVAITGGTADEIVGRTGVALPEDAFVLKLSKSSAALMAPALDPEDAIPPEGPPTTPFARGRPTNACGR